VKLTTHLHLVPKSGMRGVIPPLPNTPLRHGTQLKHRENFTFTFTFTTVLNVVLGPSQLSIHWVLEGSYPDTKRPEHEAEYPLPPRSEFKSLWRLTSISHIIS